MIIRSRHRRSPEDAMVSMSAGVTVVGRLLRVESGLPYVDFEGNVAGPLLARTLVQLSARELAEAGPRPQVLLQFEGMDTSQPIVMGLLFDTLLRAPKKLPDEVLVDGKRIEFNAREELVLRCGGSSVTLRADGTIVIKGRELNSRASGRNRITGSTVAIN